MRLTWLQILARNQLGFREDLEEVVISISQKLHKWSCICLILAKSNLFMPLGNHRTLFPSSFFFVSFFSLSFLLFLLSHSFFRLLSPALRDELWSRTAASPIQLKPRAHRRSWAAADIIKFQTFTSHLAGRFLQQVFNFRLRTGEGTGVRWTRTSPSTELLPLPLFPPTRRRTEFGTPSRFNDYYALIVTFEHYIRATA